MQIQTLSGRGDVEPVALSYRGDPKIGHIQNFMLIWRFLNEASGLEDCKDDLCSMLSNVPIKSLKYGQEGAIIVELSKGQHLEIKSIGNN